MKLYPITCLVGILCIFIHVWLNWILRQDLQITAEEYAVITGIYDWKRYLTALFIHASFEHLLFNMFSLFIFSVPLERMMGSVQFLLFYLIAGMSANFLAQVMTPPIAIMLGASSALCSVFGAYLYMCFLEKHKIDPVSRKMVYIFIVLQLVYPLISSVFGTNVSFLGHFCGFLTGFFIYGAFKWTIRSR